MKRRKPYTPREGSQTQKLLKVLADKYPHSIHYTDLAKKAGVPPENVSGNLREAKKAGMVVLATQDGSGMLAFSYSGGVPRSSFMVPKEKTKVLPINGALPKIEHGIPFLPRAGLKTEHLKGMKAGDSFHLPNKREIDNWRKIAKAASVKVGYRIEGNGFRLWRVQ